MIRRATPADIPAIRAVARASGFDGSDGDDPAYLTHLLDVGTVALALAEPDGEPAGFAATVSVGGVTMLADLFVDPSRQSRGTGRALLDAVFEGTAARMTFSSHDPRAITLYARAGMTAHWPLLYLRGSLSRSGPVQTCSPEDAAAIEAAWTGIDRTAAYRLWSGSGRAVRVAGGVGAIGEGRLHHAATEPGADPDQVVRTLLGTIDGEVRLCIPGHHPAASRLLRDGFVVEDFDLFMTTEADIPGGSGGVFSSGLC
jgi:ribosomal protein S18 acetylase RimI-like enzyme